MIVNLLHNLYKSQVDRRNRMFDQKINVKYKASCPVISIGNLSMGGTGKTPMVQFITRMLLDKGKKPVVIGRGYKKKQKGKVVVSDGKNILATAENAGDEMYLLAKTLPVPVIAHEKKYLAAAAAEMDFDPDCIVVDDGFQHRYLERDLDIVLIDEKTNDNPYLPPKGRMREEPESLNRADIIVKSGDFKFSEKISKEIKNQRIIQTKREFGKPYSIENNEIMDISDMHCIAFSGIGSPEKFNKMLEQNNFQIAENISFSDHVNYSSAKINHLVSIAKKRNINVLLTTEKDSVKLVSFQDIFKKEKIDVLALPLIIKLRDGSNELSKKIDSLFA
jgi:tetraacyldisaccharide 4'-kinase